MDVHKIIWRNELSINNLDIDSDHKKLIEVYNDLVDLIILNSSREEFARILSEMTDYTLIHFKKEETYMRKFAYPKLEEHKKYHNDYNYKVAMYNINLLGSNSPKPQEILEFLQEWWENHILVHDLDYEKYKKEIHSDIEYASIIY